MRRKVSAPPKSYTKRLFENPELLRQKLLEEANELAEARTKDHVAAEAADVLYFAMVACARAGVKLADVCERCDNVEKFVVVLEMQSPLSRERSGRVSSRPLRLVVRSTRRIDDGVVWMYLSIRRVVVK